MLEGLGLDQSTEAVYRFLLGVDRWTVPLVAERLAMSEDAVLEALQRLLALRLLEDRAGDPQQVRAVEPHIALQALLRAEQDELHVRQQTLDRNRAAVQQLLTEFADLRPRTGQPSTERLLGADAVNARLAEIATDIRYESATFQPQWRPGIRFDEALAKDKVVLAGGARIRSVWETAGVELPGADSYLRDFAAAGAQCRFVDAVPMRMLIFDREAALVPLDPDDTAKGALLTTDRGTVAGLYALFERVWDVATQPSDLVPPSPRAAPVSRVERDVLRLLAQGHTDETVAARLGLSVRTVRRAVRDMMDRTGARSRFELGVRASAEGWPVISG